MWSAQIMALIRKEKEKKSNLSALDMLSQRIIVHQSADSSLYEHTEQTTSPCFIFSDILLFQ